MAAPAEPWRCFVALDLPAAARAELLRQTGALRELPADVRWVKESAMHLTLRFLGDTAPELGPAVRDALRAVRGSAPLALVLRGLGRFPERGRPRVVWAGIEDGGDGGGIVALAAAVDSALRPFGFRAESRPFTPHLTLGRVRGARGLGALEERIAELGGDVSVELPATDSFRLYRSHLRPAGATHEVLEEFDFVGGEPR